VSTIGILFFSSIIISYFVGMWAGIKIKKPIVKPPIDNRKNVITPIRRR